MVYKLSETLTAHSKDVRGLSSPTPDLILSASRDNTAISWTRPDGAGAFTPSRVLRASTGFVSAVAYLPPSPDAPQGYAITGGQDSVINVYSLASTSDDPDLSLIGHTQNVCALHVGPDGTIISGSWDGTAKVWKNFQEAYELKGHQQAVWAVMTLPNDQYLTGGADKTIRLWHRSKCEREYRGHTDVVRGIALITDIGFASCANSGDIILWTLEGDMVHTLSGHTSFVYALSVLPSGDLVSAGEDRTVRVWHDFECTQTIVHPAISVWAVSTMPNGDIVSGCSDGVVRVFSEAEERWAAVEDQKAYDEQVAAQALPSQAMSDMKTSDPSVLTRPGNKPGQTVMVKSGSGTVEVHQWDSASQSWQKIGDVVDAVGPGRRQLYEGREYDYVFDIDVQEGAPPLKLPYNTSENPFTTAQRFLERHELPMSYIDQVVDFITKNTAGEQLGGGEGAVDPYTGASRYRSNASSVPAAGSSRYADPYTGSGRYTPAGSGAAGQTSSFQDPYTGASRYQGTPTTPAPAPQAASAELKVLPVRSQFSFKHANVLRMRDKVSEYSDAFRDEISAAHFAIHAGEIHLYEEMFVVLGEAIDSGKAPARDALGQAHLDAITAVLERWPTDQRWPVLDLGRLLCGLCPHIFATPDARTAFLAQLFRACDWDAGWERSAMTGARQTNALLAFRAASNAFQPGTGVGGAGAVLGELVRVSYAALGKTQRAALATLLYNFSVLDLDTPLDAQARALHLRLLFDVLTKEPARQPEDAPDKVTDVESVYRAAVALGNVVYSATEHGTPLTAAEVNQAKMAYGISRNVGDERLKTLASDLSLLLLI